MNNRVRSRVNNLIVVMTVIVFALSLIATAFFAFPEDVSALADPSSATLIGGGAELYDRDSGEFNDDVKDDLVDKLFGKANPVQYIKSNGATDWETYGKNSPSALAGEQYYVVPASTINSKIADETKRDNGFVITLGGLEWMVASLTLADTEQRNDNVIVTLFLANNQGTSRYYSNTAEIKGNNAYSRSIIRNNVLLDKDNATWNMFSQGGADSFAEKYLVQPKNIKYQQTETIVGRQDDFRNCPNDALSDLSSGWHSHLESDPYKPDDEFDGHRYDEWGNDYIWLPSITETGASDAAATSSIWNLSNAQRGHNSSGANYSWLRSGYYYYRCNALYMQASGAYFGNYVYNTNGVRPALHLNLSAIGLNFSINNPEDVNTTYNGESQTLRSLTATDAKAVSWYSKKWYEHTNEYIEVTYPETSVKNIGEYWVSVELQQNWFDDVRAEVEADATANGWTEEQKNDAYELRKPKFIGEADVSDPEHMESDTVRWFKIIVKPKELTLTNPSYNASTGVFTPATFANESEIYADRPVIATRFTGTAENGTKFDQIDVVPNRRGTYTAKAVFIKSADDKTEYYGNYVIKDADNMTCTVTINRGRLPIVGVAESSKPYVGKEQSFALSSYSSDWANYAELTLPDGVTLSGNDTDGWSLSAREAGSYDIIANIKASERTDWCWNTGDFSKEDLTSKTFTITVTRKTLIVDFTSTSGGFLLQAGSDVKFGAEGNNVIEGDDVKLTLEYVNSANAGVRIPVTGDKLDASAFSPSTYYLIATLKDDAAKDNKNYSLEGGEARQEFTVSAKNVVIDSVNWQYSQNNGVPTPIASGAGLTQGSPFAVTYNGSAYVFAISTSNLASQGVKIDASYGSNGYTNGSQTNATANAVAITVRIMPLDDAYAFNDENGKPLAQQYKDFTIYIKVDKADVDFSNVKWSADELEYNAVNQSVSIESGLPSFLSASYNTGATGRDVGEYTAEVSALTVTNQEIAKNYNVPTNSQIQASEYLKHKWNIIKKRITVTWINKDQTGENGTVIFVPTVSDNSTGALVYTYYNADKTVEMTLADIFADYDATVQKDYYVCVRLKASGGSYNATNCVLIEGGEEVTESYQGFKAGDQKNPVRVGLVTNTTTYNKSAQAVEIEFEGGNLTLNDFVITYKNADGTPLSGAPTNAGNYKVVITLDNGREGEYAIVGECEFDYTIEKASYDISSLKWVDTENGNAEYTDSYVWAYGVSHTLSLIGSEGIEGLTIGYSADTEANLTGENAGEYKVIVEFSVIDSANWNTPENIEFVWNITPYTPDLSGVTWNYNTESPFVFGIENSKAKEYGVYLVGLPEGLEELVIYGEDTGRYSDAGSHITTFEIDEDSEMRGNFGELVFGSGLDTRLVWEIKSLTVEKPEQKQNKVFRPEGYTFSEITNLPSDWEQYFEVTVLDAADNNIAPENGTWKFLNVDQYRIQMRFKTGMNTANGGTTDNVKWSDNGRGAYQVTLKVERLIFDVNGWIDGTENMRATLDSDSVSEIEKYFDYVIYKREGGENVGDALAGNATLEYDTDYIIYLRLKSEYVGNVAVNYNGDTVEETAPYAFKTEADPLTNPPEYFYRKPVGNELTVSYEYTGEVINFEFGDWFVPDKMQVISGEMFGTEFGEYVVRVGFKRGSLSAWAPEDAPRPDTSPVTITFVITNKMVAVPTGGTLEYSGEEQTFVPEGFDGTLITVVSGDKGTSVGEYTLEIALKDPANTVWEDGATGNKKIVWNITAKKVSLPTASGTLEYNGKEQAVTLDGFDDTLITIVSGDKGISAGEYSLVVALKDSANTVWEDGTTADKTIVWNIAPRVLKRPTVKEELRYNGTEIDITKALNDFISSEMTITGDVKGKNAGEYTATVTLKNPTDNVWASEESEVALSGGIEITLVWTIGKAQILPSWKDGDIPSLDTPTEFFGLIEFEYTYYDEDGKTVSKSKLKDGETYQVVAKIKSAYANNFEFITASGDVSPTPTASMPYAFEAVVEGDNDNNNNNNNNGTSQGTIVAGSSMPEYMWIVIAVFICGMLFNAMLLTVIIVVLLSRKEKNGSYPPMPPYPYYYPPYGRNNDEDEYEDDDEDDEDDEPQYSGREGGSSYSEREPKENDDKEDARRGDEIAAADSESMRYVPDGAVVIAEGQIVNKNEARRLEDEGSFYAFEKREGESVMTVADGAVVITGSERLDVQEAILLLSDDQKMYIFGLRDYAIEKSGEKASFAKYHLTVGKGTKQVVKLSVKDGEVVAYFRIEDERLRKLRMNAKENDAEIKIKETEIAVGERRGDKDQGDRDSRRRRSGVRDGKGSH